jgi:hypothetical protein
MMASLDFEGIRRKVVDEGGLKCLKMQTLRDASPYKKLGPGVNEEIHDELDRKGLGHWPNPLPLYQTQYVYVYDKSSGAGMLIGAVTGTATEDGAKEILKTVNANGASNKAEAKLEEVRNLLVQLQDVFRTNGEGE